MTFYWLNTPKSMIKKIAVFILFFTCLSFTFTNNFKELVLQKLEAYTNDFPEKIYVQTDKPYYTIGDDIWYAAYLVNGINHTKSGKSNIIYVEIINDKDSIVSQKNSMQMTLALLEISK